MKQSPQRIKKLSRVNACHVANWFQFEKQCNEAGVKPNRKKFMRDYGIETSGKNLKRWIALYTDPETKIIDEETGLEVTCNFDEYESCCTLDMYMLNKETGIGERSKKVAEYERDQKGMPVEKNPEQKPVEEVPEQTPVEAVPQQKPVEAEPEQTPVDVVVDSDHEFTFDFEIDEDELIADIVDNVDLDGIVDEFELDLGEDDVVTIGVIEITSDDEEVETTPEYGFDVAAFTDDCEFEGAKIELEHTVVTSSEDIESSKITFSVDGSVITLIHDATTVLAVNSNENEELYEKVFSILQNSMMTRDNSLLADAWQAIDTKSVLSAVTYGRIRIAGNEVFYDGVRVTGSFEQYLIEAAFSDNREYAVRWMKFVDKVLQIHNEEIKNDLAAFVMKDGLQLADDGDIIAYKGFKSNGWDRHTGETFYHKNGTLLKMPSSECDHDRNSSCGPGIHFATKSIATSFAGNSESVAKVKIDPRSIVAIPGLYCSVGAGADYGRCSRLQIIESKY